MAPTTTVSTVCGECGSDLMPVGSSVFCPKPGCSMYARGVPIPLADYEARAAWYLREVVGMSKDELL